MLTDRDRRARPGPPARAGAIDAGGPSPAGPRADAEDFDAFYRGLLPGMSHDLAIGAAWRKLIAGTTRGLHLTRGARWPLPTLSSSCPAGEGRWTRPSRSSTWRQRRMHDKPIVVVDVDRYRRPATIVDGTGPGHRRRRCRPSGRRPSTFVASTASGPDRWASAAGAGRAPMRPIANPCDARWRRSRRARSSNSTATR